MAVRVFRIKKVIFIDFRNLGYTRLYKYYVYQVYQGYLGSQGQFVVFKCTWDISVDKSKNPYNPNNPNKPNHFSDLKNPNKPKQL